MDTTERTDFTPEIETHPEPVKKKSTKWILLIVAIAVILIGVIATSVIISGSNEEDRVREYVDGKILIDKCEAFSTEWHVYSFNKDSVAVEYWNQKNPEPEGDLTNYVPYEVSVSGNDIDIIINGETHRFVWNKRGKITSKSDYFDSFSKADFNIENERKNFLCKHDFDIKVIKEGTCTEEGTEERLCKKCGLQETVHATTAHTYEDNRCTLCNSLKISTHSPETWFTHPNGKLKYKNCQLESVTVNTSSITVFYYMFCSKCRGLDSVLQSTDIPIGYQSSEFLKCSGCYATTTVELKVEK